MQCVNWYCKYGISYCSQTIS